jgi:hypothetical protein
MRRKALDKAIAKEIKEDKWKEREERKLKKVVDVGSIMDRTIKRVVDKGSTMDQTIKKVVGK